MTTATRALTIRPTAELYSSVREIARRRQISVNTLVLEALENVIRAEEDARLYEAFGQLGEDADEADVEFAAAAQWEVVRRGDS